MVDEIRKDELPQVKRDQVGQKHEREFVENGKPMKEVSFTEKEIDSVHLTKIAPMFFFCTDNNKILMIPFSIQFEVYEFLQLAASMSGNLTRMINKDKKPEKKEGEKNGSTAATG